MRSELSKLPKDILIEIIEKGFNFGSLQVPELRKKRKEIDELIKLKTEEAFKDICNKGINERLTIISISNNTIRIARKDGKYSFTIYKRNGYSSLTLLVTPGGIEVTHKNMNDLFYHMLNYLDHNDGGNLLEVLTKIIEFWEF